MKNATNTTSSTNTRIIDGLSQAEEKACALLQHLGNDYFVIDGIIYQGTEEDARQQYNDYLSEENDEPQDFNEWVTENISTVDASEDAINDEGYKVLTDEEADKEWEESLNNYIEECIMPEVPETIRNYFDEESWKKDARMDGRGHSISHYDGHEHEEEINGITYYIYRN